MSNRISRRRFLRGLAVAAGSGALAACKPEVIERTVIVEKPVEKVVEKIVKETVIVEGTPQVVEKIVKETVIVAPESTQIQFMTWDYTSGNEAMNAVIESFHKVSDNRVEFTAVPFAEFNEKIAALVPAGQGPDVAKPYYGWVPSWKDAGFILPLPEEAFPQAELETKLPPMCKSIVLDGKWWAYPISVRTMGMFYWADALREAGVQVPIESWSPDGGEWYDAIEKLTKYDDKGNVIRIGQNVADEWVLLCMMWQNGNPGHSDDFRTIQWNTEKGREVWDWIVNIDQGLYKGQAMGLTQGAAGFVVDQDCMFITHVGHLGRTMTDMPKELNWGTMGLPAGPVGKANMGTFWPMAVTSKAAEDPKKLDVAIEFLQFCGTRDAQVPYASFTGELPATIEVANDPLFTNNPLLQPFIAQLGDSFSYFYVDANMEVEICTNAWSKVHEGQDPGQVLDETVAELQALRDAYWEDK